MPDTTIGGLSGETRQYPSTQRPSLTALRASSGHGLSRSIFRNIAVVPRRLGRLGGL
jgi:hypothetical protein